MSPTPAIARNTKTVTSIDVLAPVFRNLHARRVSCVALRFVNVVNSAHRPVVSVITPAFNAAHFLPDTIRSVLAQTFQDFELVIADDGSTDGTPDIVRQWTRTDARVRLVTRPNGGSGAARNSAMAVARGEYFALLDSDDLWDPPFLAAQIGLLAQDPDIDVVTGNAFNLGGAFNGQPLRPVEARCRRLSLLEMIEHEDMVCVMSVFRRRVFERLGGFNEIAAHNEDYDFWLRAAHAGFAFLANPEPLAHYRRHSVSKSTDESGMIAGILCVFRRMLPICGDLPLERAAIRRQINRFEQQLLFARAKASLVRRDFAGAAETFGALSKIQRGFRAAAVARMSRMAPHALLWAYRAKSAWRARWC